MVLFLHKSKQLSATYLCVSLISDYLQNITDPYFVYTDS